MNIGVARTILGSFIVAVFVFTSAGAGDACSRILWATKSQGVYSARSMDWYEIFDPEMVIYPRGINVDGGLDRNAATWTSQFGSLIVNGTNYDNAAVDGMNERGLTGHLLYLEATQYEKRDGRPGISYLHWLRYVLDTSATVTQALDALKRVQVVPVPIHGKILGVDMALEDPTGDSAIIEFVNHHMIVHHGPKYVVMTNDPPYNVAIRDLKRYKPFGGDIALPGNIESIDRFVRAEYFLSYLPQPKDHAQAVAFVFQVIHNVAVPFGAPYAGGPAQTYPTWWLSASDLTDRVYYFSVTASPNVIWVDVANLNFASGQPILRLDPKNPSLVGDVTRGFSPITRS